MTHRTDAEATIASARDCLAETQGQRLPTDVLVANAARAQALLAVDDTIRAARTEGPLR